MIVWDDPKSDDYTYQTDFSYRMNHISKTNWMIGNIVFGIILGSLMAIILFGVPDTIFSDPARMVIGILIGGGTRLLETRAERTTKIAQAAMVVTFAMGIITYAGCLLRI